MKDSAKKGRTERKRGQDIDDIVGDHTDLEFPSFGLILHDRKDISLSKPLLFGDFVISSQT